MKKLIALAFVLGIICSFDGNAQEKPPSKFGLQAGYGSEIEQNSFGINAEFFTGYKFSISPGIAFYVPIKEGSGNSQFVTNFFEANLDMHAYLYKSETVGFYALMGLNHVRVSVDVPSVFGEDVKDNETGLNLGVGICVGRKGQPYFEIKHETTYESQMVFVIGIRF